MSDPTAPDRISRSSSLRGKIKRAPATATDSLTAVAINYSEAHDYEVPSGQWSPHDGVIPVVDDPCLIVFDDDGDAWLAEWIETLIPDPGWVALTAESGWVANGTHPPEAYKDKDGVIWTRGYITNAVLQNIGSVLLQYPDGYRPEFTFVNAMYPSQVGTLQPCLFNCTIFGAGDPDNGQLSVSVTGGARDGTWDLSQIRPFRSAGNP